MEPKVSILTPVYNGGRTIAETIESVLAQAETDWEHIIIDDGSTDDTASVVRTFSDPRIKYYHQANAGRSAARNRGIDLAQGDYLLFLDADDWLLPNALRDHLAFLTQHPEFGVSVSDGFFCTVEGREIVSFSQRRRAVASGSVLAHIVVDPALVGGLHAALVRRRIAEAHGIRFDPNLVIGEDWHFFIEVARYTQFGFTDAKTCRYRWYAENTINSADDEFRKEQLWRGREKVMCAPYFDSLPLQTRREFFYHVLIDLLADKPDKQESVVAASSFLALPREVQGRLLRLAASENLLAGKNLKLAKTWLKTAWLLVPYDVKGHVVWALSSVSPQITGLLIKTWRAAHAKKDGVLLPLEVRADIPARFADDAHSTLS